MSAFAWTAPGANYPEFLNITECPDGWSVTARGPSVDGRAGSTVVMTLPVDAAPTLAHALMKAWNERVG